VRVLSLGCPLLAGVEDDREGLAAFDISRISCDEVLKRLLVKFEFLLIPAVLAGRPFGCAGSHGFSFVSLLPLKKRTEKHLCRLKGLAGVSSHTWRIRDVEQAMPSYS
jgi:hypothetical protein